MVRYNASLCLIYERGFSFFRCHEPSNTTILSITRFTGASCAGIQWKAAFNISCSIYTASQSPLTLNLPLPKNSTPVRSDWPFVAPWPKQALNIGWKRTFALLCMEIQTNAIFVIWLNFHSWCHWDWCLEDKRLQTARGILLWINRLTNKMKWNQVGNENHNDINMPSAVQHVILIKSFKEKHGRQKKEKTNTVNTHTKVCQCKPTLLVSLFI